MPLSSKFITYGHAITNSFGSYWLLYRLLIFFNRNRNIYFKMIQLKLNYFEFLFIFFFFGLLVSCNLLYRFDILCMYRIDGTLFAYYADNDCDHILIVACRVFFFVVKSFLMELNIILDMNCLD